MKGLRLLSLAIIVIFSISSTHAATITVCSSGCNKSSIQEAINDVNAGDTINVLAGTYYENIDINKSVSLFGEGPENTIINISGTPLAIVNITANNVNFSGFTVRGLKYPGYSPARGIAINSNNSNVSNNVVIGMVNGISGLLANNNTIDNNTIKESSSVGVAISAITNNNITNNNILECYYGVNIGSTDSNLVANNIIQCSSSGYYGIYVPNAAYNITIINNTVYSCKRGIELYGIQNFTIRNNTIFQNDWGIHFGSNVADYNEISFNNISNNSIGVFLGGGVNTKVINNTFSSGNVYGIQIGGSRDSLVANNTIISSKTYGFYLLMADNVTIRDNIVSQNYYGIGIRDGSNASIYNNVFNNTYSNVNDYLFEFFGPQPYNSTWNTTKTLGTNIIGLPYIGGNLWVTPTGTGISDTCDDLDDDGICDINYTISSNNTDYLPLAKMVGQELRAPILSVISPANIIHKTTTIELNVSADETIDTWWYEYNGNGTNIIFTPNTTFYAGGSDGLKNITVWANDTAGNENYLVVYFTLDATPDTVIVPVGGGGGGSPAEDKETKGETVTPTEYNVIVQIKAVFSSIAEGKTGTIYVPEEEEMPLTEMKIKVKNKVTNVKVELKVLTSKPSDVTEDVTEKVFKYIDIGHDGCEDDDIETITIKFKVEKSWLEKEEVDSEKVVLKRYKDGEWKSLPTTKSSEDDNNIYFDAESPGLSHFAVAVGEEVKKFDPALAELMRNMPKVTKPPETELAPSASLATTPPELPLTSALPNSKLLIDYAKKGILLIAVLGIFISLVYSFNTIKRKKGRGIAKVRKRSTQKDGKSKTKPLPHKGQYKPIEKSTPEEPVPPVAEPEHHVETPTQIVEEIEQEVSPNLSKIKVLENEKRIIIKILEDPKVRGGSLEQKYIDKLYEINKKLEEEYNR